MKLRDYLLNLSTEKLTSQLEYLDQTVHELHKGGYFIVGDLADIDVINDKITMASFKDKIDYLKSGYNINGDTANIFELCLIGISAYNKLPALKTMTLHGNEEDRKKFINFIMNNEETLFEHGNVPSIIQEYYIDVFDHGNITYLNDFINKNEVKDIGGHSIGAFTKRTEVGRALSEKEDAAFVSVLLLPSMLALIYISVVVIYFMFFYNGG